MFDLAIDSKLRGCDLVKIRIADLVSGARVRSRAIVVQRKQTRGSRLQIFYFFGAEHLHSETGWNAGAGGPKSPFRPILARLQGLGTSPDERAPSAG